MVWLSILAMIGRPPNIRRRIYSDTDSPTLAACSLSLSSSAVVIRTVHLEGNRVALIVFFFIAFLPFNACEKRSAEHAGSPEARAFGKFVARVSQLPTCNDEQGTGYDSALFPYSLCSA